MPYPSIMEGEGAHIIVTLDTKNPIDIEDFVSAFASVASQYDGFMKGSYPEYGGDARIFVKEVSTGSIIADLIPIFLMLGVPGNIVEYMKSADAITDFVIKYGDKLSPYFEDKGESDEAGPSDFKDLMGTIAAIANDPDGKASIEAVYFKDGKRDVTAALKFSTTQARKAVENIESHKLRLGASEHAERERVLMIFTQSNIKNLPTDKRTGEKVVIEEISNAEKPLIYASSLAEQQIKHEIREADDNVYKKGFVVDVMMQTKNGRLCAYKVTHLHQVIDISDD